MLSTDNKSPLFLPEGKGTKVQPRASFRTVASAIWKPGQTELQAATAA